jgi:dienelactone hydrolase
MSRPARAARVLLTAAPFFALLTGPGCNRPASVHEVPDPPSIVDPMPAAPGPADAGKPGRWEPVKDTGTPGRLFVVEATGAAPARGVVLVHSWWGVNAEMRELARQLAAHGATVVLPDLYDGVESTTHLSAPELALGVAKERANALLGAARARLESESKLKGRPLALVALGSGGPWAWRFVAAGHAEWKAVAFDSVQLQLLEDFPGPLAKVPLLLLAGDSSSTYTPQTLDKIAARAKDGGAQLTIVRVANAGNDVLDRWALGWTQTAYDEALQNLSEFLDRNAR